MALLYRASKESIAKARFDDITYMYVNAMSACCGLSALETIGKMMSFSNTQIPEYNINNLKLCKMLILHSRRLLKQWKEYEPHLFTVDEEEQIVEVDAPNSLLLQDLFDFALGTVNNWYPEYSKNKKIRPDQRNILPDHQIPEWELIWKLSVSETKKVSVELGTTASHQDFMNTFWLECRRRFKVLEKISRALSGVFRTTARNALS